MDISLEKRNLRYRKMVDALMDNHTYAELVLQGGYIINVITREIYKGDIAIKNEFILLMGDCSNVIGNKTKIINVEGEFLSPGFIDSHMHFESSMLTVTEFSKLSIKSGTTTLFADPHEIGNVLGIDGIKSMIDEARNLPNRVLFTIPGLVPDVPGIETPGEKITSDNVLELLNDDLVQGLGEMQGCSNMKAVYEYSEELIDDLMTSTYYAKKKNKTIEGNAPLLFGAELAAHSIICGSEISCHETTRKDECVEKLRNGVTVFMREGSTQKNMAECIRAVTEEGMDSRKLVLATDDMVAEDLIKKGHMNDIIKRTIDQGVDPVEAIQMATINAAYHYNRKDIGVLAPGKAADICVISDLKNMIIDKVILSGKLVASNNELLIDIPRYTYPDSTKNTMKCRKITKEDLTIKSSKSYETVRSIVVVVDQNLTECREERLKVEDGYIKPSVELDVLPLISIERHGKTNSIGKTFVSGMKMKYGAIAQSIGHDTHNLIVCGTNYDDMVIAANRLRMMGGGIALVRDSKVVCDLELDVAGLMTDKLTGEEVSERINVLHRLAKDELKCEIHSPFMHLSFLSLVTSPKWKISDMGLINAETYEILDTVI